MRSLRARQVGAFVCDSEIGIAAMPKTPGRPPKPSEVKKLEGNRRQRGRDSIKEDPRGIGTPEVPETLTDEALVLWQDVVGSLPLGILSSADNALLEMFAREWATYRKADREVQRDGELIFRRRTWVMNPWLRVRDRSQTACLRLSQDLGLSPVARARLVAPDSSKTDPMALLLGDGMDPNGAWSTVDH
jgi:P27 family predicted phage terminase small subunit